MVGKLLRALTKKSCASLHKSQLMHCVSVH